jgi:hypothetical protein
MLLRSGAKCKGGEAVDESRAASVLGLVAWYLRGIAKATKRADFVASLRQSYILAGIE